MEPQVPPVVPGRNERSVYSICVTVVVLRCDDALRTLFPNGNSGSNEGGTSSPMG